MRCILYTFLFCTFFFPATAQYSLTASIGVGTADAGSNRFSFNSIDYTNYRSLTGSVTFMQYVSRSVEIGGTLSYQQYIIKTIGGGGTNFLNSGDRVELDENDAYLFLGPVLDIRIFRFLYLDFGPSVGVLLKSNELYGIDGPPYRLTGTDNGVETVLFQLGLTLKQPIRVAKHWKIVLSESYSFMPGELSSTETYGNANIRANFALLQIGVMRSYPKKKKTTDQ
ncbi:MAG: hypothetical protein ACTHJ0_16975 [Flavipsychrobacter sp.]